MTEDAVGVAVAQFAPVADADANLAEIDRLARLAAARGAEVILFPEYASAFIDPFDATLRTHAQDLDGAFTRGLRDIAGRPDAYGQIAASGPAFVDALHDGSYSARTLAGFLASS